MITVVSETDIINDIINYVQKNTPITNFDEGSVAGGLIRSIAKQLYRQYEILNVYNNNSRISTASGINLDDIGMLLNCPRRASEDDTNYRYRITHQIQAITGANYEAIRLGIMGIASVKRVEIKNYARGIGTFDVYVITDELTTDPAVLSEAQNIIDNSIYPGISGRALSPQGVPVTITISTQAPASQVQQAQVAVKSYFDTIGLGGTIVIDQITKAILDAGIPAFDYKRIQISGYDVTPEDYTALPGERLYLEGLKVV